MAKNKHFSRMTSANNVPFLDIKQESTVVEFGGIERVNTENSIESSDVEFDDGEGLYTPPIDPAALSVLLMANSYHGAIVEAYTRILSKDYIENPSFPFSDMMDLCKNLITFGNGYIQVFKNIFGEPLRLGHVPAQPTRRC